MCIECFLSKKNEKKEQELKQVTSSFRYKSAKKLSRNPRFP